MNKDKDISEKERIIDKLDLRYFFSEPIPVTYEPEVLKYCRFPYKDHPRGCPNWGRKKGCPPNAKKFIDLYEDYVYVMALGFSISQLLEVRRKGHPDWTIPALLNIRHWQNSLNADLRDLAEMGKITGFVPEYCPEAMGVNVFATCETANLKLIRNPFVNGIDGGFLYKVVLLAKEK